MPLEPGEHLGPYEILGPIGAGGMGEVWEAEDTRLSRRVAIKVLPDRVAGDSDRLARLEREARTVASLNHPNIVTLHAVEEIEGRKLLVMERVEGRTLAEVIPAEGFELERFFRLAVPLADAVAAAHARGVVHRDLKPSNVMVTAKDGVKILDFGLAKLRPVATGDEESTLAEVESLTSSGQVMGTLGYMSPEQIRGETPDPRSDVFALGSILYEMATGRRPFRGDSGPDLVSSILRDEPPAADRMRSDLPRHLGRLLSLCLRKAPDERLQSALDLRNELKELEAERAREEVLRSARAAPATKAPTEGSRRALWVAALLIVGGLGWLAWSLLGDRPEGSAGDEVESDAALGSKAPEGRRILSQITFEAGLEEWPAYSPDGSRLVYSGESDGYRHLFLRDLASGEVTRLTEGPRDDIQAAWSPDGSKLLFVRSNQPDGRIAPSDVDGYYSNGDVWLLDLDSGVESRLFEDAVHPAFSPDGNAIAVDAPWAGPRRIWITDVRGRNPRQLSTDSSEAVDHTAPSWSPTGDRIVFRLLEATRSDVAVVDVDGGARRLLTDDEYTDLHPVWDPGGEWIYFPSYRGGGMNLWRLAVGPEGELRGAPRQVTTGAGRDVQVAVSRTGDLAFVVQQINADLWSMPVDPATGRATGPAEALLRTSREESRASWSPAVDAIAFNSDRAGEMNLYLLSLADRSVRQVTTGPGGDYQPRWSPDGSTLVFFSSRSGNVEIWAVARDGSDLRRLTDHPGVDLDPFFSPDGGKIAFHSDRSGRLEVWVMSSDGSEPRQLSDDGAKPHFMQWTRDGKRVIFSASYSSAPEGGPPNILAVDVETGATEEFLHVASGAHLSLSSDDSLILDSAGHRALWIYPVGTGESPYRVFEVDDPENRIDYPSWSPDGRRVAFDLYAPRGGDIWLLEGLGERE